MPSLSLSRAASSSCHSPFSRFLSFTFYLSFEVLFFFFLNLSSQLSQNHFPPLHHSSNSLQPAAFVHRYATHGQMTLSTKCVCVCVRLCEKRSGNYFGSDLSKLCGSSMLHFLSCWSSWLFHILSVHTVKGTDGKLNTSFISRCLCFIEFHFCALLNFLSPCLCNVAETDDYAEIVDEEDTYTMPSSK